MSVIGVTAGIGSGKSTVLNFFAECGAATLVADSLVREAYTRPEIQRKMKHAFGKHIFVGRELDRKALAAIVFSDKKKLKQLEGIVHPVVFRETKKRIAALKKKRKIVAVEIPLLFESSTDFGSLVDVVCVVKATQQQRLQRLKKRGMTRKQALQRMACQSSLREKLAKADVVIDNTRASGKTKKQVKNIMWLCGM